MSTAHLRPSSERRAHRRARRAHQQARRTRAGHRQRSSASGNRSAGFFASCTLEGLLDAGRQRGVDRAGERRRRVHLGVAHGSRVAAERGLAGQELVGRRSRRARTGGAGALGAGVGERFGRHVRRRPDDVAPPGDARPRRPRARCRSRPASRGRSAPTMMLSGLTSRWKDALAVGVVERGGQRPEQPRGPLRSERALARGPDGAAGRPASRSMTM